MKRLFPLLLATILVISPGGASAMGIMEWRKKHSGSTTDEKHFEDQQRYHQVESQEDRNTSSEFARGNMASQGIKEKPDANIQEPLDLSEAALKENIEAAREDEAFWLDRQEWLVEMEQILTCFSRA